MIEREARAQIALVAAQQTAALLRERFLEPFEIRSKSASIDLVTDADTAAESLCLAEIRGAFPDDAIVAEESGESPGGTGFRWIIDPLDGTTNFANLIPHFAVSIAVAEGDEIFFGVVADVMRGELFHARLGGGAVLDAQPARVTGCDELIDAVLATGFPYDRAIDRDNNQREFDHFNIATRAVRRFGAAALDLAWVACGRFDGFWEMKLSAWDVCAGGLLVREAGGRVTDYEGGDAWQDGSRVLATNTRLHQPMLEVLAGLRSTT